MTVIGLERPDYAVPAGGVEQVWVRRLGWFAAFCALAAAVLGLLGLVDIVKGVTAWPAAMLLVAFAGLASAASVAAHRTQATLLGRLNLFGQALEASPDAQLILAADQSVAYANAALRELFPTLSAAPLGAIAARLDGGARSQEEFERLLAHASAGRHAVAALPIRESGEASGWFNVSVHPLAGRRGYSFWRLQDITARHEMEEVIRDEQNKLVDFLDNAPIGFYSVDGAGRFLFINETLAQWLGGSPDEIVNSGAALQEFARRAAACSVRSGDRRAAGRRARPQGAAGSHHLRLDQPERRAGGR
jgi:two-component system cell cycle sensor histidine kinase/response regulator CckA